MTRLRIAALVLVSLSLPSCNGGQVEDEGLPDIAFPTSEEPLGGEALLRGRLSVRDGCLVVGSYLLLWPDWMRLVRDSSGVAIIDEAGAVGARVGDEVEIGGGEIAGETRDLPNADSIPAACRSMKTWMVAELSKSPPQ
jgi:hypothetical protein